jgi:hypothetical protein
MGILYTIKVFDRWLGENVAYLSFTQELFSMNQKGYPVLSLQYEQFLKKCLMANIHIALTLASPLATQLLLSHFKYFAFVLQKLVSNVLYTLLS